MKREVTRAATRLLSVMIWRDDTPLDVRRRAAELLGVITDQDEQASRQERRKIKEKRVS